MIGHITYSIFIPVIALVLIPIIIIKFIQHQRAVRSYIKTVTKEIVLKKIIIVTACLHFYGPAIFFKNIVCHIDTTAYFHVNADRIFKESIMLNIAISNIFQKNAVGRR